MSAAPPVPNSDSLPELLNDHCHVGEVNGTSKLLYYAKSDFIAIDSNQLPLEYGDCVNVLEQANSEWWWAELGGSYGYVPGNHLSPTPPEPIDQWENEEYFGSYGNLKLHLEMLKDQPRMTAYQSAIKEAAHFIKDKVVLDVGCGTGIMSLLAAKVGGAKKVFGVEASEIAEHAEAVVCQNSLEGVVSVFHCKMEEAVLPEKVDLILSEWMGTFLIFEMMLECVLIARDKWLKPDGVMWPSHATLYLVPCTAQQEYDDKITFWKNVYGMDFSPLIPLAHDHFYSVPIYNHSLESKDCLSDTKSILKLHLKSTNLSDIEDISSQFDYNITKAGVMHGFASWFQVEFSDIPSWESPVILSTGPDQPLTHWKQDLLMVDTPLEVFPGDHVIGSIRMTRNKRWRRHIKVNLTYQVMRNDQPIMEKNVKEFTLWK
ncbi:protein arginine N-methyltransferase 2-like isoform X1 [Dysidea avara]|uniref:protein arginine N-methyltransferase 2-like isoform X1 n=1 Tax=Dysidea avara TaxID=196820 RepID=UPI0033294E3B